MIKKLSKFIAFTITVTGIANAQETFPVNGLHNQKHITYAFTNAHIFIDYKTEIKSGTIIIKDEKIVDVGEKIIVPNEAVTVDLKGRYIYPSFIDAYSEYGIVEQKKPEGEERRGRREGGPQLNSNAKGAYGWNEALKSDFNAFMAFANDEKTAAVYRKNGFGSVLSLRKDGVSRGSAAFVNLTDENENKALLKNKVAALYSFNKGTSTQDYPSSLMGSIALLRQTYYDAQWYKTQQGVENNITLEAWNNNQSLIQIFEVDDKLNALRADKIGDEFGVNYIIKASGNEYQRINEIKQTNDKFILPLNFPETVDLTDPDEAINMSLSELKHWEMAPANAASFEKAGIEFALTCDGLKDKNNFFKQLQRAIASGLTEQQALKSLTETPAQILKVNDMVGSLKKGMYANFIITSKNVFDKENIMLENWVGGKQFKITTLNKDDLRGNYNFDLSGKTLNLHLGGEPDNLKITVLQDTLKLTTKGSFDNNEINASFEIKKGKEKEKFYVNGLYSDKNFSGYIYMNDGSKQLWNARFSSEYKADAKKDSADKKTDVKGEVIYPFIAYGNKALPVTEEVIFQNATVWTNEKEGILQTTDVWIKDGKILKTGKGLASPTAKLIDGKGKHLTPGIIDEHSHIAATGNVNEGTQSISSEVRIADIIDCDDINIYRQLSGGVTTSHILHGSANAIGGQTQLIKLRWGKNPEQMKFENADGFIKFALGENVKQSNWGDRQVVRYPQTRMGVEQTFIDGFTRAKEYQSKLNDKTLKDKPRRDLELEALSEILNKKRFITCHSYEQSEINMLMHVADSFHFRVNTFTHILEGYKVADKMKKHGVGASTFSDWWAYKFEVMEAIPYNGAILNGMNVITAYNSDDAEMARRLNQEAAKGMKYGKVSEEDALKFVTLNPAKLLHIDHRVGSIVAGKDADIVLWNDHPLSIYAKPLYTFVDGICYYSVEKDEAMRKEIASERARIIAKINNDKDKPKDMKKPAVNQKQLQHCEDYQQHQ